LDDWAVEAFVEIVLAALTAVVVGTAVLFVPPLADGI